jgi:thiamine-phosphate pyrophosphorylase
MVAEAAIRGGVTLIQLRDKCSTARDTVACGKQLKKVVARENALLIINDRIDICQAIDADGVHLGQDDVPLTDARSLLPPEKIIGITCRTVAEAQTADAQGADYLAVGPIFASPTKPTLEPLGVGLLSAVTDQVELPLVAIGGITSANVSAAVKSGATIIAVASALLQADDIEHEARCLTKEIANQRAVML